LQVGLAAGCLVGQWIPILRWTAFHYVGDKHLLALQTHCLKHGIQQLTRSTHKRLALLIFIGTRRFADNHPMSLFIAYAKNRLGARAMENALSAAFHGSFQ
jgi:hypothetical protein